MTVREYANTLESGHLGIPTEYDYEYRPFTITDFIKDVFGIDLRKLRRKKEE